MNKDEYYQKLHEEIAKKYNVPYQFIRSCRNPKCNSLRELLSHLNQKLQMSRHTTGIKKSESRKHSKKYYRELIRFVISLSQEDYDNIRKGKFENRDKAA